MVFTKYTGSGEVAAEVAGVGAGVCTSGEEETAGVRMAAVSWTLTWGAGGAVAAGVMGEGGETCSNAAWGGGVISRGVMGLLW
jgi:hypothetical protein